MTQVNELLKERDKSRKKHKNDDDDDHHHKNSKKQKRHEKEKEKEKQEEEGKPKVQTKTIEQLRAERLKRESEEHAKAQRLLLGIKDTPTNQPKVEADDRKRRYNNQFNPDLAKY